MRKVDPYKLAESVRYIDDIKTNNQVNLNASILEEYESFQSHSSINVNPDITPDIYMALKKCLNNLNFPEERLSAFVYPSSEVNATCFQGPDDKTIITFSSSLINLLSGEELQFVIGHELGHSLLHHIKNVGKKESALDLLYSRAAEISVDRIGLLASKDLNSSLKAIIKSSSGLDEKHIRFDVSAFLNQLRNTSKSSSKILQNSTHPSFLLRAKSLLRFSMSDKFFNYIGKDGGQPIDKLDKLIKKDLKEYIDGSFYDDFETTKTMTKLWASIARAAQDNRIDKDEKVKLFEIFGEDLVNKVLNMLKGSSKKKVNEIIKSKISENLNKLKQFDPSGAKEHFNKIKDEVTKQFGENSNSNKENNPKIISIDDVEIIINTLDENFFLKKFNLIDRVDFPYWFNVVKQRSTMPKITDESPEEQIAHLIWGHCDEYNTRLNDPDGDMYNGGRRFSQKEKIEFIKVRIIGFGEIFKILLNYNFLKDSSFYIHSVSSLYGSIKYALSIGISKKDILFFFDKFNDDKKFINGVNPFETILKKVSKNN
tara:strand:+ start:248 stop:1870 length:1623 start_codon:yes stop_codon:yes gene_type:complete